MPEDLSKTLEVVSNIALVVIAGFLAATFLPWWSMGVVSFAVGAWRARSGKTAFSAGSLGVAVLWLVMAGFIHVKSGGILTHRIAQMLGVPADFVVLLVTALVGGLVGGLCGLAGFLFRCLWPAPTGQMKS